MLRKQEFNKFISNYSPFKYEEISEDDPRYALKKNKLNYAIINRDRLYYALKYSFDCFIAKELRILDLGAYPGTFLRVLQQFLPDYTFDLWGAGMNMKPDFVDMMQAAGIKMITVNLDPENYQLSNKNYPVSLPFEDESVDFISALEIIEHLSSPFHMLREAKRVLRRGGKILLTTPNITRIGSVLKLLYGKTNLDTIVSPGSFDTNNEWREHTYEYSMREAAELLHKAGFTVIHKVFFNSNLTHFNSKSTRQKLVDLIKVPFYLNRYWREHLLVVAEK